MLEVIHTFLKKNIERERYERDNDVRGVLLL